MQHRCEIELLRLPVFDGLPRVELVDASDHFIDGAEAKLRHQFANFFRDHPEVIHDVFRLAGELLAQHRILRRHTDRTGIQMADAHHDAAGDDQRGRRKAEFFSAEQRAQRPRRVRSSAGRRSER